MHPEQRQHSFGVGYQGVEFPDGIWVPPVPKAGNGQADDVRDIWQTMQVSRTTWVGSEVADLGCNTGYFGIRALRAGAKSCLFGDLNAEAVSSARSIYKSWKSSGHPMGEAQFVHGDMERWFPGKKRTLDAVFLHQVIYHLAHPIPFLRCIRDALRPGGIFYMWTRIAVNVHEKHWEWVPNRDTMERTLFYVGFSTVTFHGPRDRLRDIGGFLGGSDKGQRKVLVVATR